MFEKNVPSIFNILASSVFASTALAGVVPKGYASPTPTTVSGTTGTTCDNPNQTTGYPDYNSFCQCPPYTADSPAFGNPNLGLVRCDAECTPANPTQTLIRPENHSLASCMNACTGSFEKAKRGEFELDMRQDGDYWFCHGVNFIQGELCEFIGAVGTRKFVEGGSDCWYLDGLDTQ
ncbi:hypothetical protein F5Y06DRAFT_278892 [Hypoxylon sp. FL0890]|nr:hypothetical protein F5Y06DRAFT_278892 [Hypoxylon sp. FL0890]